MNFHIDRNRRKMWKFLSGEIIMTDRLTEQKLNDWEIWQSVLEQLREQVTKTSFKVWFQPVNRFYIDRDTGIIYMSSREGTVNDVLNSRYKELIEQAAAQVLDRPYKIIIEDAEQKKEETIDFSFDSNLLHSYTFENYVVGSSNKLAYGVSKAAAEHPSLAFNPLFIYSDSGLGKTHLLHAIGNYVTECFPEKKALYVSSEEFMRELIEALGHRERLSAFKRKYRRIDVLLIDDIQFLEGKEATQEEFFHTFNELYNNGRQIVITSDKSPAELDRLPERLVSRFSWNMVCDIQQPDYETRVAILNSKAKSMNVEVDGLVSEALALIAEHIKKNVRELEGALTRLAGFSAILEKKITPEFVKETLTDIIAPSEKITTSDDIKDAVCRRFNLKVHDLESGKRSKDVVVPRHIAMYLCRELIEMSFVKIGEEFGGRNHATVMSAYDRISKEMQADKELELLVNELINEI